MKRTMTFLAVVFLAAMLVLGATPATAQKTVKIGASFFLAGAAAGAFGIPARNGMEVMVDAINRGH